MTATAGSRPERLWVSQAIPILMYHQIDVPPARGTPLRGLVVSPRSFAWQMAMLRMLGFKGLSMRDLEPYLDGRRQGRVVGITFDDGYQNNFDHALPILRRYGHTATCYAVSGLMGQSNVWDHGVVAPKPLMDKEHSLRWLEAGMDIGSHTCRHIDLTVSDDSLAMQEMTESKAQLQDLLAIEVRHFCYPYGRIEPKHALMAQAAGYVTATTMRRGRVQAQHDPWLLPRVMVACATNPWQFLLKLVTRYEDRRG
jgi:peptidoglycan/xylan/chitin deacetylase (PgdA/CDA1 family)